MLRTLLFGWAAVGVALYLLLSTAGSFSGAVSSTSAVGMTLTAAVVAFLAGLLGSLTLGRDERDRRRSAGVVLPVPWLVAALTAPAVLQAGGSGAQLMLAMAPWVLAPVLSIEFGRVMPYALPSWGRRGRHEKSVRQRK